MPETPKGLATVAFLKARLDTNQDHLGLFEPLVADALLHVTANDFGASDVAQVLCDRTGISVPIDTLQTVLGRFTKRNILTRAGGRYFRGVKPVPDAGFDSARAKIAEQQAVLGGEFVEFAKAEGIHFANADEGLSSIAAFVSDNKVHLLLRKPLPESPLDRSSQERKVTRTVARFITQRCLESESLRPAFDALVEGMIIEDTLLLRDIRDSARLLTDVVVILDTPLLFPALQMASTATSVAVAEGLHLLRQSGARTIAFDTTVDEMRRILAVYEERLPTAAGRLSLYPTELSRYVLKSRLSAGDIRLISATLEERLKRVHIEVRSLPARKDSYTLDEAALTASLVDQREPDPDSPRVRHDVDCIAGILTLRAGRTASSIERCGAVFVTTSGRVVRNAQQWYISQHEGGIPPIIHHLALTSIAWLKKPTAAPAVKVHELAAVCAAALRPTRDTWTKVLSTLRNLTDEGLITSDEGVAVVVSELIEPTLARLDDEVEPDADSIQDAIERVRDAYRKEASAEASVAVNSAKAEVESTRAAAAESVARAESQARMAQDAAAAALQRADELVAVVQTRLRRRAAVVANLVFWCGVAVLAAAALLSVPGVFDVVGPTTKAVCRILIALGAVFGVYGAAKGGSLADIRRQLTDALATRLVENWLSTASSVSAGGDTSGGRSAP